MKRSGSILVAAAFGIATLVPAQQASAAAIYEPAIISLSVTPKVLPDTGGNITITASLRGGETCSLFATYAPVKPPQTVKPCKTAFSATLHASPVLYETNIRLEFYVRWAPAYAAQGASAPLQPRILTVDELSTPIGSPNPEILTFNATPRTVPYGGGNITVSASLKGGQTCRLIVTAPRTLGYELGGLTSQPCGTAYGNVVHVFQNYEFGGRAAIHVELVVHGSGVKTASRSLIAYSLGKPLSAAPLPPELFITLGPSFTTRATSPANGGRVLDVTFSFTAYAMENRHSVAAPGHIVFQVTGPCRAPGGVCVEGDQGVVVGGSVTNGKVTFGFWTTAPPGGAGYNFVAPPGPRTLEAIYMSGAAIAKATRTYDIPGLD